MYASNVGVSITEGNLYQYLGDFLTHLFDGTVDISQPQQNQVSIPVGNLITMTSLLFPVLSTHQHTYSDRGAGVGTENRTRTQKWVCQLDFYGPESANLAGLVNTLMRDEYTCEYFRKRSIDMRPLYADEPMQRSMIDGENQYENHWTFSAHFQFNAVITTPMEFTDHITVGLVEADANFPPENA